MIICDDCIEFGLYPHYGILNKFAFKEKDMFKDYIKGIKREYEFSDSFVPDQSEKDLNINAGTYFCPNKDCKYNKENYKWLKR